MLEVNIKEYSEDSFNQILTNTDVLFKFSNDISIEDLKLSLDKILTFEEQDLQKSYNYTLHLKNLSTEHKVEAIRVGLQHENLKNANMFVNILLLLKTYNTYDFSFFEDINVFADKTSQFMDMKTQLEEELKQRRIQVITYFMSLFKSLNKFEFTYLDSYIQMPNFYHLLFLSTDIVTISSMMNKIKLQDLEELLPIKNAYMYVEALATKFQITNSLLDTFYKGISNE